MPYPPDCRINRYIMECKCHKMNFYTACILELIDTLWNVNAKLIAIEGKSHRELIDTLWNVNSTRLLPLYLLLYELIDTLWNVNLNAADVVQLKREN